MIDHRQNNLLVAEVEEFDSLAELGLDMHSSWNHGADNVYRIGRPCVQRNCVRGSFSSRLHSSSDTPPRWRRDPIGRFTNPMAEMINVKKTIK